MASRCCWRSGGRASLGRPLDALTGITLPFTTAGVIVAETFVAMPFLVITVEGAFRAADRGLEEAAATLGASRLTTFRRVTLPLIGPSLVAGAVLCWARALGEFGATITFAGNFPGRTQTMPLAVYLALESDPEAAIALSLVLLLVSVAVLAGLRDRWLNAGATAVSRAVRRRRHRPTAAASTSTCGCGSSRARCWASSAPTAPARPPCCGPSRGWSRCPRGTIRLGDLVLDDADADTFVPPDRRPVGLVFQNYRLFPHLDVLDNVAFAPRSRGASRRAARAAPTTWLERLDAHAASPRAVPRRSPAGRRSGWRWPARWPPSRTCCCWTSRCPPSTPAPG